MTSLSKKEGAEVADGAGKWTDGVLIFSGQVLSTGLTILWQHASPGVTIYRADVFNGRRLYAWMGLKGHFSW